MSRDTFFTSFELKSTPSDDGKFGFFEGYGAVFGNRDSYSDVIKKGAFGDVNAKSVSMFWQHNPDVVLGSYQEVKEDGHGLLVKGRLNLGVTKAREAYALLKEGDLNGLSIGYSTEKDQYDAKEKVRYLEKIKLYEISLVSNPANDMALLTSVKQALDEAQAMQDIEQILRGRGFSRNEAKTVISKVKSLSPREEVTDDLIPTDARDATEANAMKQLLVEVRKTAVKLAIS